MKLVLNDLEIEVIEVNCDGEKIYTYSPKYNKMIILKYTTSFEAYKAYQSILNDDFYDATGKVFNIIDK